ncbi:MAG: hypothetical protein ACYDDI_13530 [Candidatus Acidiferrales bacterium]
MEAVSRHLSAHCGEFGGLGLALSEELNISIGEIPLCLHIPETALREKASARYSQFFRESPEALPIFLQAAEDAATIQSPARRDSSKFSCNWNDASLVWQDAEAHFGGVRHEYGLDSLIRILLSVLLVPRNGFLLHAATVLRGEHTYVFTGHSGAGKSTVASLSPAGSVLTDEISLLRATDESWHAYGTPFWGEFHAEGANTHAPIKGIYVLVQSTENRVEPILCRDAVRAMLPNVLFFSRDPGATDGLLRLLADVAQQIPCYKLFFRKESSFWEVIA